jgi:hypothetical protein
MSTWTQLPRRGIRSGGASRAFRLRADTNNPAMPVAFRHRVAATSGLLSSRRQRPGTCGNDAGRVVRAGYLEGSAALLLTYRVPKSTPWSPLGLAWARHSQPIVTTRQAPFFALRSIRGGAWRKPSPESCPGRTSDLVPGVGTSNGMVSTATGTFRAVHGEPSDSGAAAVRVCVRRVRQRQDGDPGRLRSQQADCPELELCTGLCLRASLAVFTADLLREHRHVIPGDRRSAFFQQCPGS